MLCVQFVIGKAKHVQKSKLLADTDFVLIKKQTLYGHNTASNCPFGVIYGSICSSRPSRQVLEPFGITKNINFHELLLFKLLYIE
jgi:hypothetical protein